MTGTGPAERLARVIRRDGPVPFDWFMEAALYDPDGGFFARGGGAGRSGRDFVTSPEVGPLFGALVAHALDTWWCDLGRPDPFIVVEAGAGSGRLAREVLRAEPVCLAALRYVMVERSATMRAAQRERLVVEPPGEALGPFAHSDDVPMSVAGAGPVFTALEDLPALSFDGVIFANELLDNLPFGIAEWTGESWLEIRVGLESGSARSRSGNEIGVGLESGSGRSRNGDEIGVGLESGSGRSRSGDEIGVGLESGSGRSRNGTDTGVVEPRFIEVAVPTVHEDAAALALLTEGLELARGARLPIPRGLDAWLARCGAVLRRGLVVLVDYVVDLDDVVARGPEGWLRTYREHGRGGSPLEAPGSQDVTADVVAEQLAHAARASGLRVEHASSQAEWLRGLGVEDLVAEGQRVWSERAHLGDLAAIAARSRVGEAAALTDPEGLGAHRVVVLRR